MHLFVEHGEYIYWSEQIFLDIFVLVCLPVSVSLLSHKYQSDTPGHTPVMTSQLTCLNLLLLLLLLAVSSSLPLHHGEGEAGEHLQANHQTHHFNQDKRSKFYNRNYLLYLRNRIDPFFPIGDLTGRYKVTG